ncbi:pentapeptide repeat-containing protein [Burkholderia ambifaria]
MGKSCDPVSRSEPVDSSTSGEPVAWQNAIASGNSRPDPACTTIDRASLRRASLRRASLRRASLRRASLRPASSLRCSSVRACSDQAIT